MNVPLTCIFLLATISGCISCAGLFIKNIFDNLLLLPSGGWIRMIEKSAYAKASVDKERREGNNFPIIIPHIPKKYSSLSFSCGKTTNFRQNYLQPKTVFDMPIQKK